METNIYKQSDRLDPVELSPIRNLMDQVTILKQEYDDVISFSAGEPDFNTPEPIKVATIQALNENYTHYTSNMGVPILREKISNLLLEKTNHYFDPNSEIMITSGAAEAINNVLLALISSGDEVIVLTPAFITYKNVVKMCGATFVEVPLKWEDDFQINMDAIQAATTSKTRAIVLNNPCNPTGAVFDKSSLHALTKWAKEKDLILISDEIYSQIVYDGKKAYSMAEFEEAVDRLVIISGFSKTYAMTGWRLGYVACDKRFMPALSKMHLYCSTCSPTFLQRGLAFGLDCEETKTSVREMVETFGKRRELAISLLNQCKNIKISVPYGAFYILIDVGMDGTEFSQKLLQEKHVAMVPAVAMGSGCETVVRMSYACSSDVIQEGLTRLKDFLDKE